MSSILDISIQIEILGEAVDSPRDFKICPPFCINDVLYFV